MRLEMAFCNERLAAPFEVTLKGSVASMRSHVGFQVACLEELLHAERERTKEKLVGCAQPSQHFVVCFTEWNLIVKQLSFGSFFLIR